MKEFQIYTGPPRYRFELVSPEVEPLTNAEILAQSKQRFIRVAVIAPSGTQTHRMKMVRIEN